MTKHARSLRTLGFDPDQPGGGYSHNGAGHDGDATPRQLTEEEQLSLAVTRLAGNEKLLEALAWRLGIPLADVRPDGREPPLARDDQEDEEELDENREQIEVRLHTMRAFTRILQLPPFRLCKGAKLDGLSTTAERDDGYTPFPRRPCSDV